MIKIKTLLKKAQNRNLGKILIGFITSSLIFEFSEGLQAYLINMFVIFFIICIVPKKALH
jgi:hypothetical protein